MTPAEPRPTALFFDFDGVLADSMAVKAKAFARLYAPFGAQVAALVTEHHLAHGGMTRQDKFVHYHREFLGLDLDGAGLDELCRRFAGLVVEEVVAAPPIPGSLEFLAVWSGQVPCFVVSAAPEGELREIALRRSIAGRFLEILGAPRTKAGNLQDLLDRHGLAPHRCLFFGDAEGDLRAAQTCGVEFLGIVPGPSAPLLRAAPAIRWARDFHQAMRNFPWLRGPGAPGEERCAA